MHLLSKRLYPAIRLLVGSGTVKQRLVSVWLEHLDDVSVVELPLRVQQEFRLLRRSMYARMPLPHESAPEASIRKMSIREATQHAECIVNMLNILADESEVLEFKPTKSSLVTHPSGDDIARDKKNNQLLN